MGIISAELRRLEQTRNNIFLNFDERVNLLIGPNATGKTAILREIERAFSSWSPSPVDSDSTLSISENFQEAPLLYVPAVRVSLHGDAMSRHLPQFGRMNQISNLGNTDIFVREVYQDQSGVYRYGGLGQVNPGDILLTDYAWDEINKFWKAEITIGDLKKVRGMITAENFLRPIRIHADDTDFIDFISGDLINEVISLIPDVVKMGVEKLGDHHLFDGCNVKGVIDLFNRMMAQGVIGEDNIIKFKNVGYFCAKTIGSETIKGDFPYDMQNRGVPSVGIHTNDNISRDGYVRGPLDLGVLSSGTQGTLLWIWALAATMATHYDWDHNWEKKPAILFIDEIENHLHPTWQRRVIPALLEHFPGLQIFATTHSPFVVAGLKAGQVHLLNRDQNGVTATTNSEDIIGWTADEILRTMMGVDEPTDLITIERSNRLRQLREKDALTTEEEAELNTLRRQVNESLLSRSGPVEPQRERYADLMKRFLLSRQSDLAQDGG